MRRRTRPGATIGTGHLGRLSALRDRLYQRLSSELDRLVDKGVRLHPETVEGIGHEVARYGRSGRVAWQYIQDLAGRLRMPLDRR